MSSEWAPVVPAADSWQPAPEAIRRQTAEQTERDWKTTLDVMRLAVKSLEGQAVSDLDVQRRCEALWQWAKTDNWEDAFDGK